MSVWTWMCIRWSPDNKSISVWGDSADTKTWSWGVKYSIQCTIIPSTKIWNMFIQNMLVIDYFPALKLVNGKWKGKPPVKMFYYFGSTIHNAGLRRFEILYCMWYLSPQIKHTLILTWSPFVPYLYGLYIEQCITLHPNYRAIASSSSSTLESICPVNV